MPSSERVVFGRRMTSLSRFRRFGSALTVGMGVVLAACSAGSTEAPVASTPLTGTLAGQSFAPASALARNGAEGAAEIYIFPSEQVTCESIDVAQKTHERWVHVITPGPLVAGEAWDVNMEHQKDGVRFAGLLNTKRGAAGRGRLEVVRTEGDTTVVRMRAAWKGAWAEPTEDTLEGEIVVRHCP